MDHVFRSFSRNSRVQTNTFAVGALVAVAGQSIAEICKDIGLIIPVPGLAPAATIVLSICLMCQNASINKQEIEFLGRRCYVLLRLLKDKVPKGNLELSVHQSREVLAGIDEKFSQWKTMNNIHKIALSHRISKDIGDCNADLDRCMQEIGLAAQFDGLEMQQLLEAARVADHNELIAHLVQLTQGQLDTTQAVRDLSMDVREVRSLMGHFQESMQNLEQGDYRHTDLQGRLLTIKNATGELPPKTELKGKEVRRIGQHPVGMGAQFDIWEGQYLGGEKVAIKVLRGVSANPRQKERFHRESKIWREVWEQDRGRYFLPYYGAVTDDGPYPYMVSPWQSNGNAIEYCRKHGEFNRHDMVKGIASGINLLHTWKPIPMVHGDLKGENILIGDDGRPLIADFSLSKILEDVTGVPFTQSKGISDSYRWFAPEICSSPGVLSKHSDMFSFAMTILELITAEPPYKEVRRTTEVLFNMQRGQRPARPAGAKYVTRGLTDNMWQLMTLCWAQVPEERISIEEFLARIDN